MTGPSTLIIRFSAMGDVALTLPVIRAASAGKEVVVLTRPPFADFFSNIPGIRVIAADLRGRHKGISGLILLAREIRRSYNIESVIDLHDVIRSRVVSALLRISGSKVYRIDKGRSEKRGFIKNRSTLRLPHTTERYEEVFRKAGFMLPGNEGPFFVFTEREKSLATDFVQSINGHSRGLRIGIAPYTRHQTKQWQPEKIGQLIGLINSYRGADFFLFGSPDESTSLNMIASGFENVMVVTGRSGLREELAIISLLDIMVSMDSSNMHLASLAGIKTVSIWGGTHPDTGFGPIGNQPHLKIGIPSAELECRPCTIYGKGECTRTDMKFKCLHDISAQEVFERMKSEDFI